MFLYIVQVLNVAGSADELVLLLGRCLPHVVPTVLLAKRDQLVPLLLATAALHPDIDVRNQLLHILFNLIKKPDASQRWVFFCLRVISRLQIYLWKHAIWRVCVVSLSRDLCQQKTYLSKRFRLYTCCKMLRILFRILCRVDFYFNYTSFILVIFSGLSLVSCWLLNFIYFLLLSLRIDINIILTYLISIFYFKFEYFWISYFKLAKWLV